MTDTLTHVALVVRDYDEAIRFFVDALRFRLVEDRAMGPDKRWVVVAPRGGGCALLLAKSATPAQADAIGDQAGGRVFLFLETSDFAGDHAHMRTHGVVFEETPREEAYGTVAVFRDLCGNRWDLIQRR